MTLIRRKCGSGHTYTLDGEKVTGVTTIIKNGFPAPGLIGWTGKVVAQFVADADETTMAALRSLGRDAMISALRAQPFEQRNQSAARGKTVHGIAERLSKGEALEYGSDIPEELAGHVESCLRFLDEWQAVPVLTETVVGSRWVPYAGTFDMVADIPRLGRVLLDYKTGDSGVWPEAVLQLAAYRFADFFVGDTGTELPMSTLDIDATAAVWLRADSYDLIPINTGMARDTSMAFQVFRAAAYIARRVDMVREAIGEALTAEVAA